VIKSCILTGWKIICGSGGERKNKVKVKSKAIPVTGCGGLYGCEMLRLTHFLDNWLMDGGEVFSLARRPHFTSQEDSWYSFLLQAVNPRVIAWLEGLGKLKKFNGLTGNGTHNLLVCSIVSQPNTLRMLHRMEK
jgi:hypothetical protein